MGITSKKTTNANKVKSEVEDLILSIANHSNGNYEVDGIIFASRFVFTTIESIDRNLRFLYTTGSDSPSPLSSFDTHARWHPVTQSARSR